MWFEVEYLITKTLLDMISVMAHFRDSVISVSTNTHLVHV